MSFPPTGDAAASIGVVAAVPLYTQYAASAVRPARLHVAQVHQPLYIPINPADRQNRQLQPQYYADSSSSISKPVQPAEPVVILSGNQRTVMPIPQ